MTAGTAFVLFLRFVGLLARTLFVMGEETQPFGCITFKNKMRHPCSVVIRAKNWVTADFLIEAGQVSRPPRGRECRTLIVKTFNWLIRVFEGFYNTKICNRYKLAGRTCIELKA